MTREEAIEVLQQDIPCEHDTDLIEALEMAIKALEQEPCADAISMDKTIVQLSHLLSDWDDDWNVAIRKCIETVKNVPPVTPSYNSINSIKIELKPCADAISRQAVLEVIEKCHCEEWVKADIGAPIEALQSVTPAEKVGHWIDHQEDRWIYAKCLECGTVHDSRTNYCPNCGAKMEGEQNGNVN